MSFKLNKRGVCVSSSAELTEGELPPPLPRPPGFCLPLCAAAAQTTAETSLQHFGPTARMAVPIDAVIKPDEAQTGGTSAPSTGDSQHNSDLWG